MLSNDPREFASPSIRVLLVDDHPAVRSGLRAGLEAFEGIVVTGEAGDGATAIELARAQPPDVAVVDVSMPGMDGFETAASIREVSLSTKIAFISGMFDTPRLKRGLALEAKAFLLKTEHPHQF